jgi:putative N6-adenine-specific DNA methylase
MFEYQKYNQYFGQIAGGMEDLGEQELKEFGIKKIKKAYRGIYFVADQAHLYRLNLQATMFTRFLAPLLSFDCHSTNYLHSTAMEIEWEQIINPQQTFAIFATVSNSKINHSKYASQVLKDAIVDRFREQTGSRPSVDAKEPDLWINLHIDKNKARISVDTSGGSLHRRGYRQITTEAPIQETVAAAIVRLSGWNGKSRLHDPMCGSGTLLSEAMLRYCRIPAAFKRQNFGFKYLPDFDESLWREIQQNSKQHIRPLPEDLISGSDLSGFAIKAATANIQSVPYGKNIALQKCDFRQLPELEDCTIICNPPYGIRLGEEAEMPQLYKEFGDWLKNNCKNSTAWIYVGNRDLIKEIGLKPTLKYPLKNGSLDGRLLKIEIY